MKKYLSDWKTHYKASFQEGLNDHKSHNSLEKNAELYFILFFFFFLIPKLSRKEELRKKAEALDIYLTNV